MQLAQVGPGKVVRDPALEDKLQRRANNVALCLEKFLGAYQSALQQAGTAGSAKGSSKGSAAVGKRAKASKQQASKAASVKKAGKGGKPIKDPKTEAWAVLLLELDERINKSKKCNLEDIYRAVSTLTVLQKHALSNIIAITTPQHLPDKQSEAAAVIKDMLFSAAAAHSYSHQQVPDASRHSAATFRALGLPADCALQSGFRVGQLLRAGYSTAELVCSSTPDLGHLRAAGVSVKSLFNSLDSPEADSLTGPAGAARLKAAGYTAVAVQAGAEGKITVWDMKLAGYLPATNSSAPAADAGPPRTPRLGRPGSACSSCTGAVVAGAAGVQGRDAMATAATGAGGGAGAVLQAAGQLQASAALKADGPWDIEYFRHQIKPLMHMQTGTDIPDLMMGTKDKLVLAGKVNAIEEQSTMVMLAPNPVKLAQQRKKSCTGLMQISVQPSTAYHMGPVTSTGGPQGVKALDRRLKGVSVEQVN